MSTEVEVKAPKGVLDNLISSLPSWLAAAVKSPRAWKTWTRCMLATLASAIIMIAQPSLNVLGQAAFFGLIASQMLPPSMALSIYLFALGTLGIGMLLGWAWGSAAWAAALHVRSATLYNEQLKTAEASYTSNLDEAAQYEESIFHGAFLDPRSSAVFGAFLFIGTYAFGYLRASKPKLTLMCIFGTIILDLLCSFGPLFPFADYMIATQLITPAACYMAIGIASTILFFPQSLNHLVLDTLVNKTLPPALALLQLQDDALSSRPSDHETWTALAGKAFSLRSAFVASAGALEGQVKMLQLEVSRGRIGPGQLAELIKRTRELGSRAFGLGAFVMMVEERHQTIATMTARPLPHSTLRAQKHIDDLDRGESVPGRSLEELMPGLADATADLRQAAQKGMKGAIDWLDVVNHTRWRKGPVDAVPIATRQENLVQLRTALEEFRNTKHFSILSPFQSIFDPTTGQLMPDEQSRLGGSVRGLFRCYVLTSNLISFSLVLVEFLEFTLELELTTPKAKFQFPSRFSHDIVAVAKDDSGGGNPLDMGVQEPDLTDEGVRSETSTLSDGEKKKKSKSYARDPDALYPDNAIQKFGRKLGKLGGALSSPNGLFALKYGLVSVALWVPAVCPSSAYFNYTNRGLWALIMTTLGVYAGEQILNFVFRAAGTGLGLVVGMIIWYIGAPGHGTGNPYGIAAATMVLIAPFLFIRIVAPPHIMGFWIMTNVTIVFVVGYGWVDEHIYQTANQGSGAPLAGRRALLVIIGFAASFIVMLFPKPVSAKLLVRRAFSTNISEIGQLYGKEVTAFERSRDDEPGEINVSERRERFRGQFMQIFARLQRIQQRMAFAKFEPGLKGPWPKELYNELFTIQGQMLSASSVVSSAYARLEPAWCTRLTERSDLMHPAFIADCISLFSLLFNALRTGTPLPPTIPIFERLAYHRQRVNTCWGSTAALHRAIGTTSIKEKLNGQGESVAEDDDGSTLKSEGAVIDSVGDVLTWQACHDEQLAVFATAIIALVHIASGLNNMHRVIIELVGERELEGFDSAQERWAKAELAV